MYSQAQLQSFFGSNYDASTISVALTHGGVTGLIISLLPIIILSGIMITIIRRMQNNQKVLTASPVAQTVTSTDSTPNQVGSKAVSVSEISDIEEAEYSYFTKNITAIDINSLDSADTSVQELIYALEKN